MYGYEINVWTPIEHNGSFSHYTMDRHVVHALSETEAGRQINLKPGNTVNVHEGLTITVQPQFIYSVECLGRVTHKVVVCYE